MNNRTSAGVGIPKDISRWAYNGNGEYLDQKYEVNDIQMNVLSYMEIGVGYSRKITIADQNFRTGLRVKYIAGLGMSELDNKAGVTIETNGSTYQTSFTFEEANLRVAGMNLETEEATILSQQLPGKGFGLDFGAEYLMNDWWSFSLAVNDLGWIKWKKDANTISLINETYVVEGGRLDQQFF